MPRSVSLHPDYKETARLALERKGFLTQGDLAANLEIALSTVSNFFNCKRVSIAKFEEVCEALDLDKRAVIQPYQSNLEGHEKLSVLNNETTWVERSGLTQALIPVLKQCRILVLTGITGIGKTALAERLVAEVSDRKRCRLNLDDGNTTPDFANSGAALLRSLGEEPTLEDQKDSKNLLAHLLKLLRTQSYLVQIDSLERLLKGNDQEGWSEFHDSCWRELFQQILAGGDCRSQLILTTQDLPGELEAIGSRYEQLWHCAAIQGLSEAEQLQLFEKKGIAINATTTDYLKRIGKLYEGHPLVLRVIAEDLKACNEDVGRYWQKCKFAELEANRPTKFSRRKLQLQVEQRVKESLEQLPSEALQLLCRSTVYRRPVPEQFWLALLSECTEAQQQAALNLLISRTLAEEDWTPDAWLGVDGGIPLRQHNLIRSVAHNLLKASLSTWQQTERQAAHLWLTVYKPAPNVPNLETVRGYLEAFDHYCEVGNWDQASEIYTYHLASTNQALHWQLLIWGYYKELVEMSRKLVDNIATQTKRLCLNQIGNSYTNLGNSERAIEYYQQALQFTRKIGDRWGEGAALSNLGIAYSRLGQYKRAINLYQQRSRDRV